MRYAPPNDPLDHQGNLADLTVSIPVFIVYRILSVFVRCLINFSRCRDPTILEWTDPSNAQLTKTVVAPTVETDTYPSDIRFYASMCSINEVCGSNTI